MEQQTSSALELLAHRNRELLRLEKSKKEYINALIPIEIQEKIVQAEKDFMTSEITEMKKSVDELAVAARNEVIKAGESIKIEGLVQAIFTPPQPKWNKDMLEGMLALVPQIEKARSFSEPVVRFLFK